MKCKVTVWITIEKTMQLEENLDVVWRNCLNVEKKITQIDLMIIWCKT